MSKAAFCGTFDPVTLGHLDVIKRASCLFDEVVVFVAPNSEKHQMFSEDQRLTWLQEACSNLGNVTCQIQKGLTVDACKEVGATILIRGIRNGVDCEYEQNMAFMNHSIDSSLETVCLFTRPEYMYCSSSNVKELIKYHLDITQFVPECVKEGINYENID